MLNVWYCQVFLLWHWHLSNIMIDWLLTGQTCTVHLQNESKSLAYINIHKSSWHRLSSPHVLSSSALIEKCWQVKAAHNQTWGGSRPLSQPCPLSLMSLNDFNILPCHNSANRCQFSVMTGPIGYLPQHWPKSNDDVQFNISVNLHSHVSK